MAYPDTPDTIELARRAAAARARLAGYVEPSAADELRDRIDTVEVAVEDLSGEVRGVTGAVMRAVAAADPEVPGPARPNLRVVR